MAFVRPETKLREAASRKVSLKDLKRVKAPWSLDHVDVTADYALGVLAHADPNRQTKELKVNGFARDMLAGEWRLNAAPIRIAEDGRLIDGEHRLWAVVRADEARPGITVPMSVATGVPRAFRPTFDNGTTRTFADVLKIEQRLGRPTGHRVYGAILRLIAIYQSGAMGNPKAVAPTHSEMERLVGDGETATVVESFLDLYARRIRQPSVCGFVYWRAQQVDEALADAWASGVMTGTEMQVSDPRYQLRERYNEPRSGYHDPREALALAVKSWNAFSTGKTLPELRWRSRGRAPEAFPEFVADMDPQRLSRVERQRTNAARRAETARTKKAAAKRS